MAGILLPNLVLPTLTVSHARGANTIGGVGLVTAAITIAYHVSILGLNLGQNTITNHYHRGRGLTIEQGIEASVMPRAPGWAG